MSISGTIVKGVIGQVTSVQKFLDEHANNFIVRPFSAQGIGGFVFSTRDTDRLELRADITDYVVEDNSAVQDHIAIKPLTVTLRGFVGELVNEVAPLTRGQQLNVIQNVLTDVDEYLPNFSQSGLEAYVRAVSEKDNTIEELDKAIVAAQNLAGTVGISVPGITAQERAYSNLQAMFRSRQIITVETPWGYLDSMAISSVIVEQNGKTKQISDISVSLKQLNFTKLETVETRKADRNRQMYESIIEKGRSKGVDIIDLSDAGWSQAKPGNQKGALNYTLSPTAENLAAISLK